MTIYRRDNGQDGCVAVYVSNLRPHAVLMLAIHPSTHLRVLWPLCSIASSSSLSCALSTLNFMVLFGPGQHFRALLALCVSYTWRPGGRLSPVGRRVGGPMKDAPTMCASAHVDWSEGWPYFEVRAISMPHDTSVVGARASV